jgi:hypothetical protein
MSQHNDPYPADNFGETERWMRNYLYEQPSPARVEEIRDAIRRMRATRDARLSQQKTGGDLERAN